MKKPGILITFEGCDGVARTIQPRLLSERLRQENKDVFDINKTDVTEVCESIREILLHKEHVSICSETELLLLGTIKAQFEKEVILKAIREGKIVLCDCYIDSYAENVSNMNILFHRTNSDITFMFDSPLKVEDENYLFYKEVRDCYLKLAEKDPDRMVIIDASQSQKDIADIVWKNVKALLGKK